MPVSNPNRGLPKQPKIEIKSAPLPTLWQRLRQIKKKDLAFVKHWQWWRACKE